MINVVLTIWKLPCPNGHFKKVKSLLKPHISAKENSYDRYGLWHTSLLPLYTYVLVSKDDYIKSLAKSTVCIHTNPDSGGLLVGNGCTSKH